MVLILLVLVAVVVYILITLLITRCKAGVATAVGKDGLGLRTNVASLLVVCIGVTLPA